MTKSKKPMITIHNASTNEVIEREMTDDEFDNFELQKVIDKKAKTEAETKATQKAALLERLGLTEDELKTILG
jgi:hypothetical protein